MTAFLPPNLLALFSARPPIEFKPPPEGLKKRKGSRPYIGVSDFTKEFEQDPPPPATRGETRDEKDVRRKKERDEKCKELLEHKITSWDPHQDPNAGGDPFKTLFVGRINYDTSETKLRRELEVYGPVRRIQMVYNVRTRKPRGYAFVEFEHEKDMHSAYKHADGKKIDGRRILVDVERGRTVKSWRPRRLGGGLGGTRRGGPEENIRHSGRVEQWEKERDREKEKERRRSRSRDRKDRSEKDRTRDRSDRSERKRDENGDRDRKERRDRERDRSERGDKDRERDRSERGDRDRSRDGRKDRDKDRERDRDRKDRDRGRDRDREERDDRDKERESRNGREDEGEARDDVKDEIKQEEVDVNGEE